MVLQQEVAPADSRCCNFDLSFFSYVPFPLFSFCLLFVRQGLECMVFDAVFSALTLSPPFRNDNPSFCSHGLHFSCSFSRYRTANYNQIRRLWIWSFNFFPHFVLANFLPQTNMLCRIILCRRFVRAPNKNTKRSKFLLSYLMLFKKWENHSWMGKKRIGKFKNGNNYLIFESRIETCY